MEYNTQRPKMKINDYGRNVLKLIDYAKTIEDRDKRSRIAAGIVDIMSRICPEGKLDEESKRKYWVHLMILSNWKLDVDMPYDIPPEETVDFSPHPLDYNQGKNHYRHYGSVMESMIKRVAEYPEGEERNELVGLIAHAMKRDYLLWNRDTVEDDLIARQLSIISDNKLELPQNFQFKENAEYLNGLEDEHRLTANHKKKKKKKKKKKGTNSENLF